MKLRSLAVLAGLACLVWAVPATAQSPYDASLQPFATKGDPRPDPRKVPKFIDDHPREIDGMYAKRFLTSGEALDWLSWLRTDWNPQRDQRIEVNRNLIDFRKELPLQGDALLKVRSETTRKALLTFNSSHDNKPHDALYAFSHARKRVQEAEADVSRAMADIASANASVDAAAAGLEILVSTNELATLAARREAIMKEAKESLAQDIVKAGRTAIGAIKDPASAMKTIGVDFLAEGFDMIMTERVLLQHARELEAIADREAVLKKLIKDDRFKAVESTLASALKKLQSSRLLLVQAAIRRTIAYADARHQIQTLRLLEEGDEQRGIPVCKFFRALAKYYETTDVFAGFVRESAHDYLGILMTGPSAKAAYMNNMMIKDIAEVRRWRGDFKTWLIVAQDTQAFFARHDEWYKRQTAEAQRLIGAYDERGHWKFTEAVVASTLLEMEKGG